MRASGEPSESWYATRVYETLAALLVEGVGDWSPLTKAEAGVVGDYLDDAPSFVWPCGSFSVDLLLDELHRGLAAQVGAGFRRDSVDHDMAWTPIALESTLESHPEEFSDGSGAKTPGWSWEALADAERRECGWDFAASPESGTWFGWFEPKSAFGSDEYGWSAIGLLVGFVVVDPERRMLRRVFVASTRRRDGIARALYREATDRFGPLTAEGPFSDTGAAFCAAMEDEDQ